MVPAGIASKFGIFRRKRRQVETRRRSLKRAKQKQKKIRMRAMRLALGREIRLFLAIFLGYLLQVTFISTLGDYLGTTPMLTLSVIAVITVCYGRMQAFWCGAIYGCLLELLLPGTSLLNLFVYPASALFWSVPFADKSAKQLEYERSTGKAGINRSPVLRTLLCAAFNSLTYEAVNIAYIYLRESLLMPFYFTRALRNIFMTALLTALILFPLRRFFGYKTQLFARHEARPPRPYRP